MTRDPTQLLNDIDALKAALAQVEAELAQVRARASDDAALIAHQKLVIEKLKRELYGPRAERTARILDQMELKLEELESAATEDEIAAERAAAKTTTVSAYQRKRPARKPFPAHLPRERVVVPGQRLAIAVAATGCASSVRRSPRRWR